MIQNTTDINKSRLRCLTGTFAAEGMTISDTTRSNIERIANNQANYQQILKELKDKYEKRI
jgi:hypothetical protein